MTSCKVVLNARAGTLIDGVEGDPAELVERAFAAIGYEPDTVMAEPGEMEEAIKAAFASEAEHVFVGGGDGSVNLAARCAAETDKPLGVLPLGTMNLFARDLGGPIPLEDAIAAFEGAQIRRVDLAAVNGRVFHTLAGLGFFTQMARAREQTRGFPFGRTAGFVVALLRAFTRTGRMRLDIDMDGEHRQVRAYALLVTNNAFTPPGPHRPRLDAGLLEVDIAHDVSFLHRVGAGLDLLTGKWRENSTLETLTGRRITVASRRPKVWLALDGELLREETPLTFEIRPGVLPILWPKPAEKAAGGIAPT